MVKVRSHAEFDADFPYDGIEDDNDFVEFPGRGVTIVIAQMLRRVGCEVSEPIHAHEHGWELDVSYRGLNLWCQITMLDPCILIFQQNSLLRKNNGNPVYEEAISRLNVEMQGDPRFRNIRWSRPRDNSSSSSASVPVDKEPAPKSPAKRRGWLGRLIGRSGAAPSRKGGA